MTDHPTNREFAERYFCAAVDPQRDRYFALFADDVTVHDDGQTHHGLTAVRQWRAEVPPVRYELLEVTGDDSSFEAVARVSGEFSGSPVTLRFAVQLDDRGKIAVLDIKP